MLCFAPCSFARRSAGPLCGKLMQPMEQTKPKKTRKAVRYLAFGAAGIWLLLLIYPSGYCLKYGCYGPVGGQNIDGFLPAFAFAPIGGPALLWSLYALVKRLWQRLSEARRV